MTELAGFLWLLTGLAVLAAAAAFGACCLRIRSTIEFILASYLLAWAWLVVVTVALSPAGLLTRPSLLLGVGTALVASAVVWWARGRPAPPSLRPVLGEIRLALRRPPVLILAVVVALGTAYGIALALLTAVNDGDALAYHLPRAAFWRQEQALSYVAQAPDVRLNGNPPIGEIGQLATMLLSGSDRYAALPQLFAYGALAVCVTGLALRLGFGLAEALFGALAFATLPVVAVQASSALNDLVVASFLVAAAYVALRPGRVALSLFALTLALALGTKLTAIFALPVLALVAATGRPLREWKGVALAGFGGLVAGSGWYGVNLAETGEVDGGLAERFDQRVDLSVPAVAITAMRLALDLVDMSGAPPPYSMLFLVPASVLAAAGLLRARHSVHDGLSLLGASLLTAGVLLAPRVVELGQRAVLKGWGVLGEPETAPFERGWGLNDEADPVASWYGPLGFLLLVGGTIVVAFFYLRRQLPLVALALVAAPWLLLLILASSVVWDPWRGRFLVFGVALAAATWGLLLRSAVTAGATVAIGTTALALSLVTYLGKPAGLHAVWAQHETPPVSMRTIWKDDRTDAQTRLRLGESEEALFRFVEEQIPDDAHVAVAPRENDFLLPYFGERLSREVSLVPPDTRTVPADAEWLALSPRTSVRRCASDWRTELKLESGWRIERRIARDTCPD